MRPSFLRGFATGERLEALGFLPGVPHYEITGDAIGFGIDLVRTALFESTYRDPVPLPLQIQDLSDDGEPFSLVVTSVQQTYAAMEHDHLGVAVGCYNEPDWVVRGHLVKSPHDPYPEFIWAVAYVMTEGPDRSQIDRIEVQLIRDGADGPRPW